MRRGKGKWFSDSERRRSIRGGQKGRRPWKQQLNLRKLLKLRPNEWQKQQVFVLIKMSIRKTMIRRSQTPLLSLTLTATKGPFWPERGQDQGEFNDLWWQKWQKWDLFTSLVDVVMAMSHSDAVHTMLSKLMVELALTSLSPWGNQNEFWILKPVYDIWPISVSLSIWHLSNKNICCASATKEMNTELYYIPQKDISRWYGIRINSIDCLCLV